MTAGKKGRVKARLESDRRSQAHEPLSFTGRRERAVVKRSAVLHAEHPSPFTGQGGGGIILLIFDDFGGNREFHINNVFRPELPGLFSTDQFPWTLAMRAPVRMATLINCGL